MTVTLEEFMEDFSPREREQVAARTAELVEEEFALRKAAHKPSHRERPTQNTP